MAQEGSVLEEEQSRPWFSPEEKTRFNQLYTGGSREEALKYLRQLWQQHADKEFIQSFTTIHWVSKQGLSKFFDEMRTKADLPCQGYQEPPFLCKWIGGIGIKINGDVVLAGNSDLQTNQWSSLSQKNGGERYTEYIDHLFVDERSCTTPFEFVLANWKPSALIADSDRIRRDTDEMDPVDITYLKEQAALHQIPLLGIDGKPT